MTRARHLSDATLLALSRREARAPMPGATSRHLAACRRCRGMLGDLSALRASLAQPSPEPSEGVVLRAWALVAPRPPRPREADRFALARLAYDSGAPLELAGVRAPAPTRRQVWRARGVAVDLRLEGAGLGSEPTLLGQILPGQARAGAGSGTVWLFERGRLRRWAPLGSSGEFSLPAPGTRSWSLWFDWRGLRLRVEPR